MWADDPAFSLAEDRRRNADRLDRLVSDWTEGHSDREVMEILQAAGVPAGYMAYGADLAEDPHSVARRYPRPLVQPELGPLMLEGAAFLAEHIPEPLISRAPRLGEHTRVIARDALGMTDVQVDELVALGALEVAEAAL